MVTLFYLWRRRGSSWRKCPRHRRPHVPSPSPWPSFSWTFGGWPRPWSFWCQPSDRGSIWKLGKINIFDQNFVKIDFTEASEVENSPKMKNKRKLMEFSVYLMILREITFGKKMLKNWFSHKICIWRQKRCDQNFTWKRLTQFIIHQIDFT